MLGFSLDSALNLVLSNYANGTTFGTLKSYPFLLGAFYKLSLINHTSGQFFGTNGSGEVSFVSTSNNSPVSIGIQSMVIAFEYVDPSNLFTISAQANYSQDCIVGEKVENFLASSFTNSLVRELLCLELFTCKISLMQQLQHPFLFQQCTISVLNSERLSGK